MNATIELLKIKAELQFTKNAIKENEVLDLLGEELPALNPVLEREANSGNIYKTMQCFFDFTKQLAVKGNLKEVKRCFNVAEKLLTRGNKSVKNAIENSYVYSLSRLLDIASPFGNKLRALLNPGLKEEYCRQIKASGI